MKEKCTEKCIEKIKLEGEHCEIFCKFVDHLYYHDNQIFTTFTVHYSQDKDALEWALEDVIDWKMKTKSDDDHKATLNFRDGLIKWGQYKVAMAELDRKKKEEL